MSTFPAESFYRGATRWTIDITTLPPFALKVSKVPTLTSGLMTLSPNTANEEIVYYSATDATNLTVTITKRGINWSSQTLAVDANGTATGDYNNSTYMRKHSQGDQIQSDVNHLHIIQDYGNLQAQIDTKVATAGWTRTTLANNAIMRTNGTGVESADVIGSISPLDTDTILMQRSGDISETTYLNLKNSIAVSISPSVQETAFEALIAQGDLVWQTPDWIYKFQQEVKTSTALGWANTYMDHCQISKWVYALLYAVGGNMTVVVASVSSSDVVTYGTPVNIGAAATPTARMALINTNKVVIVYSASVSANAISVVGTISGTSISIGTPLSEGMGAASSAILSVFKVRTDVYCYCDGLAANSSTVRVNTISWTTCSTWTTIASFWFGFASNNTFGCYLSDNLIAVSEGETVNATMNVKIYAITGWGTTVATTYTGAVTSTTASGFLARYSDTEVVITNSNSTEKCIFTVPWAWTTLTKTTLTSVAASGYSTLPLYTNIYWINTWSSILVYQRDVLIGTITGTPAYNTQSLQYDNWRILFFNGATLIPTIINLGKTFLIGLANNGTWVFTVWRNSNIKSWVIKGYRYYLQSDWTVANGIGTTNTVTMTSFFGRGVMDNKIMIEV
jgi:hypothetical protein